MPLNLFVLPAWCAEILKGRRASKHVSIVQILFLSSRDDTHVPSAPAATLPTTANTDDGAESWRRYQFRLIYDAHHDDLWRYCLRRSATVEEAEEALSETFTVAWRRLDELPKGDDVRPWLFGVARNNLRSGWRRYRRSGELHDRLVQFHVDHHGTDPADAAADGSTGILAALGTLKERDQELLRLAAWDELPHAEIAQLLGCTENAVAIRLHRARGRLEAALRTTGAIHRGSREPRTEKVKGPHSSLQVEHTDPGTATEGRHQ